jgi:hypothetical protein
VTTFLDLLGAGLLIAAAYLELGLPAGLAVAGVLALVASWRATR